MDHALLLEEKNTTLSKRNRGMPDWKGNSSKFRTTWDNSKFKKEEGKPNPKKVEKEDGKAVGN